MRVLMWMGGAAAGIPGGHLVQMEKTAAALRAEGVDVRTEIADPLPGGEADLVHGFALTAPHIVRRPSAKACSWRSRRSTFPVSTSAGGCAPSRAEPMRASCFASGPRTWLRHFGCATRGTPALRERYDAADLLLPNSVGEREALIGDLGARTPIRVVPNGVDEREFSAGEGEVPRDCVAYVGRPSRTRTSSG